MSLACYQPTYEELKHFTQAVAGTGFAGYQPTYEELKHLHVGIPDRTLFDVTSLPMRN